MKKINPFGKVEVEAKTYSNYNSEGIEPFIGCICSGNTDVRNKEARDDWWQGSCRCYCAGDDLNKAANKGLARDN